MSETTNSGTAGTKGPVALLKGAFKLLITLAIFAAIFAEFGGGPVPLDAEAARSAELFHRANPEMPGIVGKLKAKISGSALPNATVPVSRTEVCRAGAEGSVYAQLGGALVRFKPLRHCTDDALSHVYSVDGDQRIPLAEATGQVALLKQGKSLVPMDMEDLWAEVTSVELSTFLPWFLFAMLIKLVGIFANVFRWDILLRGQGIHMRFQYLCSTYFVGRYFGIVTPSTMGLDGWRLYDTISRTRKPVECTTAIAVERVIGLVGLLAVILLFMPFTELESRSLGELAAAMKLPLAAGVFFALFLLLKPSWFKWIPRLIPVPRVASFVDSAIESATAYSSRRGHLLLALGCAIFGQITTMLMYFGNAMALGVEGVPMAEILYASAVMTLGTFLAPSASGEGVRELVFVALLGGKTTAAKAFLIGHLGFWIEKLPLSIPGGILLFKQPDAYQKITHEDLAKLKAETSTEAASLGAPPGTV
jgi:uncharacterized membrane protein YbhN (UPF0104 family)